MAKIRKEENMDTPVSSMIDVVFLLIIFFVVTASLDEDLVDTSIELAAARNVKAVDKKNPNSVVVNVTEDGKFNIETVPQTKFQLRNTLLKHRQAFGNEAPVVLRADRATLYRHMDTVMEVVGDVGLYKLKIVALADE